MKKGKTEKAEKTVKAKEFSLSETELLRIENAELKMKEMQRQFAGIVKNTIDDFCKRVGQKREDLITMPDGRIFISPKGTLQFKEV